MTTNTRPAAKSPASAGLLATLRFSSQAPVSKGAQKQLPRQVMADALTEQIALAKADLAGETYEIVKSRFVKDAEGKSIKTDVRVTPRRMYWTTDDGTWMIALRYGGSIPVELSEGKPSIIAGTAMNDVVNILELILSAVKSGEIDAAISAAAHKMKRKPTVAG